ncbi:MAG: dUTP diphosphatase [Bacteroides sp.]|nr:dUTP diphosphatase [Prevotella sp.]MCM1407960.1 dUTP diphosphatase [Treponema brennaborense]MCM1469702.1 dUTP diphosphatase [Bacteroides sp.]
MSSTDIVIKCTAADGIALPEYKTKGAAGADLCAAVSEPLPVQPGEIAVVPTGIFLEIPEGFEAQIRSRSGLAAKYGIACLNAPGTIDSDYRGEIKVILINHGKEPFMIRNGDRIAQIIIAPVVQAKFLLSDALKKTERGDGGFGSTGIRS